MFKRGEIYVNVQKNDYHLSLGFKAYGVMAIQVRRVEDWGYPKKKANINSIVVTLFQY